MSTYSISQAERNFPWVVVTAALSLGVFNLPAILLSSLRPVNIFWNWVFSFGWFISEITFGPTRLVMGGWQTLIGMVVWPIIVCYFLYFSTQRLLGSYKSAVRNVFYLFLLISCFLFVPNYYIGKGKLASIPTYIGYFSAFS